MASPFLADGQLSWAAGVNSLKPTTIQSATNPDGMPRNGLCWLNNGSVRDGGISPRGAYNYLGTFHDANGLYQGEILYEPIDGVSTPYFLIAISGHILQVPVDTPGAVVDLSVKFNLFHPATEPYFFFVQGEQFVVIQAGDLKTLPLFWDGATLRRSVGIIPVPSQPSSYALNGTGFFKIPSVGKTVTVNLDAPYPGVVGDAGDLIAPPSGFSLVGGGPTSGSFAVPAFNAGRYTVTAKSGNTVTFQVISTKSEGTRVSPGELTFNLVPVVPPTSELPAAGPMDYFHGRFWYGQGTHFAAGDIVGGISGTLAYNSTDSILKVTENPLALSGDGFAVPSQSGNIRALKHTTQLDASLGQGEFLIFTRKSVYKLDVPISRTDWIGSDSNNQPKMTPVQINNGAVGDRSVVNVNGDVYYQSLEPSIRSLIAATRFFGQPGNRSISANEQRVLQFVDRALLRFTSGICFDNRLLMTSLPTQTPQGVIHKATIPLDFIPESSFQEETQPIWQGVNEGIDIFQMAVSDFGGRERAFATVRLQDGTFSIWELTTVGRLDNNVIGEARIDWSFETPAFTHEHEFLLKRTVSAELWVDRVFGEVVFRLEYRPDGSTCWLPWHTWKTCAARNTSEDCVSPIAYPLQPYGEGFKQTMVLPKPPVACESFSHRPSNIAYQQQCRLTIHGYCRVRGFIIYAEGLEKDLYRGLIC